MDLLLLTTFVNTLSPISTISLLLCLPMSLEYGVFPSCPTRQRLIITGASSTIHSMILKLVGFFTECQVHFRRSAPRALNKSHERRDARRLRAFWNACSVDKVCSVAFNQSVCKTTLCRKFTTLQAGTTCLGADGDLQCA